jgi:two-component system repressor protein LuxO
MNAAPARILVVEDLAAQAELARIFLTSLGHDVQIAATATAAFDIARAWQPDGILLDIELPDYNGLELLKNLRQAGSDAVVVVVTATASMELAKQAIRGGAEDYVVKPYNRDRLGVTLRNALDKRGLDRTRRTLETALVDTRSRLDAAEVKLSRKSYAGFIGASPPMRAVYDILQGVAASKASVFVTGESGTGKELAAEALHKMSPRAPKQFVALNCGAIPRDLLESEVFGHVKGAFTGATADRMGAAKLADGGTLFLDEIGEMPLEMQVKLLRFVQTGTFTPVGSSRPEKVDVRFVCATNRDPMLEVEAGRFREDLYYRLYVVPVELPPLRARDSDVLLLAQHFLAVFSAEENKGFTAFAPDAEALLHAYSWPGNVRQLQNVVRNIVVLHQGTTVTAAMIPPPVNRALLHRAMVERATPQPAPPHPSPPNQSAPEPAALPPEPEAAPLPIPSPPPPAPPTPDMLRVDPEAEILPLAEMERRMVLAALLRTNADIPRAAALLQINPSTVYRKVSQWRKEGSLPEGFPI